MENRVLIGGNMLKQMNFSLQQNFIPLFRNLILTNKTGEVLENVTVRMSFDPAFASGYETFVSVLQPEKPLEIKPVKIAVSPEFLYTMTEKTVANITIEVFSADGLLAIETRTVDILAYDQWTGSAFMPEMISAFVTPNHPLVREVISEAGVFMQKWTNDPAFTAYVTQNPNNVKMQMAAIYASLQQKNIAYSMPPASFEDVQRIRMPENVLTGKMGTCLDLAVLYCSCLESVGLNPIMLFTEGHAFAGCRLSEETFPDSIVYDCSAITKRTAVGIDEICLVECTDFVAGKSVDFDTASRHADENLADAEKFQHAVDITRARGCGIRPIPTRISENGVYKIADYSERKKSEITNAPSEIDMSVHAITAQENKDVTKQDVWERKLLDLSLRNSLLNFRPRSSNIQLMTTDLAQLEDEISGGNDFKVMPAPTDFCITASENKMYEVENEKELVAGIVESEFKSHRLRTFIEATELEKTLKKLHRDAKVSIEENGANTLYLALGLLRWYETDKSEKARYAPIVLVPIDIVKKVHDKSYTIRIRDEETLMNITLLEMLRQNFGITINGLTPLPCDEKGVNLPLIFNTVRQGVMAKSRWDIEEYAFIGQFSFSRFIMWNDIKNRSDDLKKNKVVSSLIDGKMSWTSETEMLSPGELDEKLSPSDMAVPMSVDSSQLAAVHLASQGESFVLHGPPGTGKSQTITNMIANALYQGKSVLFIAEKMAALTVVQKRLSKIGLAPFCLELHSNKAQKRAVLNQLENTINIGKIKEPQKYAEGAQKLSELRSKLNGVMESLHKTRNYGLSAYEAIVLYEQYKEYKGLIDFTAEQVMAMDETSYDSWKELINTSTTAMRENGSYFDNPFRFYENREYSIELREELLKKLKAYIEAADAVKQDVPFLSSLFGVDLKEYKKYKAAADLSEVTINARHKLSDLAADSAYDIKLNALKKLLQSGKDMNGLKAEIEKDYDSKVLSYDAETASLEWKQVSAKWFLPKFFGQGKLVKALKLYAKIPVTKQNIEGEYERLNKYKALKNEITSAPAELTSLLQGLWMSDSTDFAVMEQALFDSEKLHKALKNLSLTPAQEQTVSDALTTISTNEQISGVIAREETLANAVAVLKNECKISTEEMLWGENWIDSSIGTASAMCNNIGELKSWSSLLVTIDELKAAGLSNVAYSYMNGKISYENAVNAYICGISYAMSMLTVASDDTLNSFSGAGAEDTIKRYAEVISEFEKLTINELVAKLSAKVPAAGQGNVGSELGILQKAIKSGGRMMSIRKLFDSIPNLLRRMCPCMLMSPISVAQYIDPAYPKFDLVIFDEASQLPTCEAVGAIARGENVVVVGDPKQLPPTSFFNANSVDEENYEKEDLESVLDDCLALSMPQKHLLWHYRSRHESLIAYSNAKYYDNKLMTFPSPADSISEVSWVQVEGFYDKGSSKQNKAEAQAVVAEIVRRISDPELRRDSIGVVTFSLVQQVLIDDLLNDEYRKNPQLEAWANEMYEPVFIKNLENVQGDERDVILFSVGYGPDKQGKVSMNFGPLNRDGGWRRLNVAITRSRKKMIVYSVITPDQIDLSRTSSEGVAGLKGFLEFAARGRNTLASRQNENVLAKGIETVIADRLRKEGYSVECNIGYSEYKVDIAVADPDNPDNYIFGIMVDSKKHLENSTARDRTVSQPGVLKGLGWNIANVYTLDWLDNSDKVIEKLKAEINHAIEKNRSGETEEKTEEVKKSDELVFEKEEVVTAAEKCEAYIPFKIKEVGTSEDFTKDGSKNKIQKIINDILKAEAPVSYDLVYKKTLLCFGMTRGGVNAKKTFENAFSELDICITTVNETQFCWLSQEQVMNYSICRVTKDDGEKRSMDEIAPQEIASGIKIILTDQISMNRADLVKETAKLFGFTRTGDVIDKACTEGIKCARAKGYVFIDEDTGRIAINEG
ncbi:MAG: DUF4011 domain-containing protein [Ruminococcaceae bacterium]|nr:DUF4011 domain-containing protein [Oscillospiraceae bacterium]